MGRYLLLIGLFLAALAVSLTMYRRQLSPQPGGDVPNPMAGVAAAAVPEIRGKQAPAFELANLQGAKVRPSDFKGKVLLVNFWATWCAPCIVEIPWFLEFQNRFGPEGLQVIGISMDENGPKDVPPFVQRHKMTYPILFGNDAVAEQFGGILGLPTTYIVDREGKFYNMHRGLVNRDQMEEELTALLGKPTGSPPPEENLFQTTTKDTAPSATKD